MNIDSLSFKLKYSDILTVIKNGIKIQSNYRKYDAGFFRNYSIEAQKEIFDASFKLRDSLEFNYRKQFEDLLNNCFLKTKTKTYKFNRFITWNDIITDVIITSVDNNSDKMEVRSISFEKFLYDILLRKKTRIIPDDKLRHY